jgi:ribosomal protein L11 methyltransferase
VENALDSRRANGGKEGMNDISLAPTVVAMIATDGKTARRLADGLAETLDAGETAVAAFEARDGSWTVEIHFEHAPDEAAVRSLVSELTDRATAEQLAFERVAARDWVAASLEGLQPVEAGRFFLHGAHHRDRVRANRVGIEIEAALAFGTGHHGTTRGCLLALDAIARASGPAPRILDVGTGTGVLAIAAARSLRGAVLAGDVDAMSVRLARQNARLNRTPGVTVIHARGLGDRRFRERAPYDLVFANILLGPLKGLALPIRALIARGGHVVLSGLLANQAAASLAAYRAHGLVLERRILLDGWATLVLRRPANRLRPRHGLLAPLPARGERCAPERGKGRPENSTRCFRRRR